MPSKFVEDSARALAQPDFDFIQGPAQVRMLITRLTELGEIEDPLGIDTETTGLDPRDNQVRLIQVATRNYALLVDLDGWRQQGMRAVPWDEPGLRELKALLESPKPKVLQNAAFDFNFLFGEGVVLGGPLFDTMVAAKLINNGSGAKNDLGALVQRKLKFEMPKELQKSDWSSGPISPEQQVYAARDAICLGWLRESLDQSLRELSVSALRKDVYLHEVFKLEMNVLRPIALMQWYGFGFNAAGAAALRSALEAKAEGLKQAFLVELDAVIQQRHPEHALPRDPDGSYNTREKDSGATRLGTKVYAGFNPRSTKQMAARFEQAGIILPPDEKGNPSLDQNLLAFLEKDYPLIAQYLEWKESVTLVSAAEKLLDSVGTDGRIHAGYRQMGTETGRLSCAGPNLQQIPRIKEFRSLFIPEDGYKLVVADFSQVELRVAAELSGEERMREAYAAGRDLHTETASLIAGVDSDKVTKDQRQSAKVANFGLLYGAGPATLRKQAVAQYGIDMPQEEAKVLVEGFRAAYPQLYKWQQEEGVKTTRAVNTATGRRRMLVGFNDKYTTRINTQVQGTAGDIAKLAIWLLWRAICAAPEDEARLIAMVHDEIVLEVQEHTVEKWSQTLKTAMESAGSMICKTVPIIAEVSSGDTWADAK